MWVTDWAKSSSQGCTTERQISLVDPSSVESSYLLAWNEHCVECAVPECYTTCPLYVRRLDSKCARFKNGIVPNKQYPGLFPYGAEIEFRRWGKLESTFGCGSVSIAEVRSVDQIDRALLRLIRTVSNLFRSISPALRLSGAYAVLRERILQKTTRRRKGSFDEFVIEVWNVAGHVVNIVLEFWQSGLKFRTSIRLEPGRTLKRIPACSVNVDLYGTFGMVRVYPENDAEAHLVFSWLDFVRYRQNARTSTEGLHLNAALQSTASETNVKCVIWDLDCTVWEGILGEQDPEVMALRPGVLRTMQELDEKGIVQSIASKNDYDDAWRVLRRLGIAQLFLYPKINWEPKSVNVLRIAGSLNIGMGACAFIDDSPFERAEVAESCPGIRVYPESEIQTLLDRSEFDVPTTEESKQRRVFYRAESERREQATRYGSSYDSFLRSCEMQATLFRPTEPEQIERCLELLHRSNQLNLSTHRYNREEFNRLLVRPDVICVCTSCRDRFGEYGIVGFASIELDPREAVLKDFVLSCRVAQKKLENAWFQWLAGFVSAAGFNKIRAQYGKTSRNGVLLNALLEVGFSEKAKTAAGSMLELSADWTPPSSDVVSIVVPSPQLIRSPSLTATG